MPHFVSPSDGSEIRDAAGISIQYEATSGMDRARARVRSFDEQDIAWQIEVIRAEYELAFEIAGPPAARGALDSNCAPDAAAAPTKEIFIAEADKIAEELSRHAIRRGPGAAWIGLDWLGDSEVFQLVCLGPDLYNGASGIAVFLAAHAAVTGYEAVRRTCAGRHRRIFARNLKSRNAARMARSLGIGGATGLGSIVYALAVMAKCLHDDDLLADAHAAAELFTDDLIAADKQLDVMGGSAGAILGLLRLYRDTQSGDALERATKCGEHLLRQPPARHGGPPQLGRTRLRRRMALTACRTARPALPMRSLRWRRRRDATISRKAAAECIAFENSSYDAARNNWPDLRGDGEPGWPCQWCHGAPGIGLARIAMAKRGGADCQALGDGYPQRARGRGARLAWLTWIRCAAARSAASNSSARPASALGRSDLRELAARRLMSVLEAAASSGDYRWNSGKRQFNLGLFRGLAGVGYTVLRQVDGSLPNVLIWE